MPTVALPSRFALAIAFGVAITGAAWSAPGVSRLETDGPHCKPALDFPEWRSVWLGHFTGGRHVHEGGGRYGLSWADQYACFSSRAACERWQRGMRAAYRRYEGYKTCLLIRNGPLRETPAPEMTLDGDSAFAVTPQDTWPVRPGHRR